MSRRNDLALAGLYTATRILLALSSEPRTFPDTGSYRWAGLMTLRPYGISLFFDIVSAPALIVLIQTLVSAACWLWMFSEIRTALGKGSPASGVVIVFLALATLTGPMSMWDRAILSESLTLSLIAAISAAALYVRRRGNGRSSVAIGVGVLVAAALVRETVFIAVAVPVACAVVASSDRRRWALPAVLGLCAVLSVVALHPTSIVYGSNGESLTNFRNMNVVGMRILPDQYVRERMESAGLPKTDPSLHAQRFAMDNDYILYKTTGLLAYANNFPYLRYLVAQMSRPTIFLRQVLPAVDKTALDLLPNYGTVGDDVIPKPVSNLLFRWSSSLHLCLLLLGWCLRRVWSQRISSQAASLITTLLVFSSIATMGAMGALLFDAMEVGRHVMPFLLASRLALVSALLLLVVQLDTLRAAPSFTFSPTRRASLSSDGLLNQLASEPGQVGSGRNNESCPPLKSNTAPDQAGVSPETPQSPAFIRGM